MKSVTRGCQHWGQSVKEGTRTGEGNAVATLELLLCPEERFSVLHGGTPNSATSTTCTHQGQLGLCGGAILLSKVGALELRVADSRGKLVELEPVYGGNEGEEGEEERREDHRCGSRQPHHRSRTSLVRCLSLFIPHVSHQPRIPPPRTGRLGARRRAKFMGSHCKDPREAPALVAPQVLLHCTSWRFPLVFTRPV